MLYDGFGADLSLRNKKIYFRSRADRPRNRRGEEQATQAQIANLRNIFPSIASPADPYIVRLNSRTDFWSREALPARLPQLTLKPHGFDHAVVRANHAT
jgi:hypothetical protein